MRSVEETQITYAAERPRRVEEEINLKWANQRLIFYARSLVHTNNASASISAPLPKSKPERERSRIRGAP
jgi:hypothetical protein